MAFVQASLSAQRRDGGITAAETSPRRGQWHLTSRGITTTPRQNGGFDREVVAVDASAFVVDEQAQAAAQERALRRRKIMVRY